MAPVADPKFPKMNPEAFNLVAKKMGLGVEWTDHDNDMLPGENEFSGLDHKNYITYTEKNDYVLAEFKENFAPMYNSVFKYANELRGEKVSRELALTYREPAKTDFDKWLRTNTDATETEIKNYKAGVAEIIEVGKVMKGLYQDEIGYNDGLRDEARLGELTEDDKELIIRYGQPWCLGDQGPLCVALPSLAGRGNGVFLDGVTCEDTGKDINSWGNPFSAVGWGVNEKLKLIPFAEIFRDGQLHAAVHLRRAAHYLSQIPREAAYVEHLLLLADSMESKRMFPFVASDAAWHKHGQSDSIFLFRAGPDETGGDGVGDACETKSRFHLNLGLVNRKPDGLKKSWSPHFQGWENSFAALINDPNLYQAQEVVMSLPQFYDVVYAIGDDVGGPNGTNIGQTLPNWCGDNGKEEPCKRRVMIFVNKTERAYNDKIAREYLMPLFDEKHYSEFEFQEAGVGIESVVAHEIAHNFGPQPGKPKPGTDTTYEAKLGDWKGTFEELKAQTGSIYIAGLLLKDMRAKHEAGEIDAEELEAAKLHYRKHILYDMTWAMKMILRATRGGEFKGGAYSKLAAIQIGYLAENGAITYNEETMKWTINFENDKFLNAAEKLMTETLKLYAESDSIKVDSFCRNYIYGDGFKLIHSDRIVELARNMPSPLFDYEINGLE